MIWARSQADSNSHLTRRRAAERNRPTLRSATWPMKRNRARPRASSCRSRQCMSRRARWWRHSLNATPEVSGGWQQRSYGRQFRRWTMVGKTEYAYHDGVRTAATRAGPNAGEDQYDVGRPPHRDGGNQVLLLLEEPRLFGDRANSCARGGFGPTASPLVAPRSADQLTLDLECLATSSAAVNPMLPRRR